MTAAKQKHLDAFLLRRHGSDFVFSVKLSRQWVELRYAPSPDERDVLEAHVGALVRVIVEGATIVGAYA